ncbi:amidohydrolase [Sporosarcina sp. Marseille-Q4063]|uniref:amidohydrolase n=1 Tax=Sporosarcina sp. Marseille-Q4063 TaxID=2810514 RepID=UPI001BB050A1|nr:amidohydrolase [Sporosarcina sp. Marseille-Q4063]QUW24009.1 amidohydrolase [Sporosarcina sp. Marseille-Q4063]
MKATVVFINGEVITSNRDNQIQEAVAINGNKIVAVGSGKELASFIDAETKVIDLEGKSLLPGFIDAHLHLTIYGTNLLGVSCVEPHIKSLEDIFKDIKMKVSNTKSGEWVRAWGFDENNVVEKRFPTKEELDLISTDHPIVIIRTCNHTSIANSKALELAGYTEQAESPKGGIVEKDYSGELTGKLVENAHMELFNVASYNDQELKKAMKLASNTFIEAGITSVHDAGGYGSGPDILRVMQQNVASGDVKIRIYAMIGSLTNSKSFIRTMIDAGIVTGLGDEKFKIGPAKIFTDGSSTGPTIATRTPYDSDPADTGILYYNQEEINGILGEAHEKGFQITAHAQGDRAIEMLLNCIEDALQKHPRVNHRHRIEHAGIAPPDLLKRMKELDVVIVPNPVFMYVNGDSYIKNYGSRVEMMYPARDYIDESIPAAFASDSPVTFCNPLLGIHASVNRKSRTGIDVGSNQRIEVLEAIKAYTLNGAYASFDENVKGSIEVGKLADIVVLSDSILNSDKDKIKNLQVEMTMIDGEILFEKVSSNII